MKPIPSGYCEAADNAVIVGRPWWRQEGDRLWRRDRRFVSLVDGDGDVLAPVSLLGEVERIDAAYLLPHPGYRAGQVWLVGKTTWICTEAGIDGPRPFPLMFNPETAFLLYDPLMPAKAPWSPL